MSELYYPHFIVFAYARENPERTTRFSYISLLRDVNLVYIFNTFSCVTPTLNTFHIYDLLTVIILRKICFF